MKIKRTPRKKARTEAKLSSEPTPKTADTSMLKADLIAIAESSGLDTKGTKAELIERINATD